MRLPTWTYLVVFTGGIFLCWYLMRGCQEPAPDHSAAIKTIDSLSTVVAIHTQELNHFKDSTEDVISHLQKDKDSLVSVNKEYKIDLKQRGEDIQGFINDLNDAEAAKDTLRTLASCDSLKMQFASAKGLVGAYIHANDSLQSVNDQIIASKTEITNRLGQQLTETNQAFFATQLTLQKIETDYNKLKINNNKRWGIGPSFGGYITKEGLRPGVGISITYTLIKF